jgi:hypothetical protein
MNAIAWVLIVIGIGAVIEGYHGHAIWTDILNLFSGKAQKSGNTSSSGS